MCDWLYPDTEEESIEYEKEKERIRRLMDTHCPAPSTNTSPDVRPKNNLTIDREFKE